MTKPCATAAHVNTATRSWHLKTIMKQKTTPAPDVMGLVAVSAKASKK